MGNFNLLIQNMDRTSGAKRSQMGGQTGGAAKGTSKDRTTAANKAVGLTDDMIADIEKSDDLRSLIRLHDLNKKVQVKNEDNRDKIEKLQLAFKHLGEKIKDVFKEQNAKQTISPAIDKKKDDKKGGK